jgi:FG-GAP-like repeat/FG-GAP repeat/PQQ-like domain
VLWKHDTGGPITSSVANDDRQVITGSRSHDLEALNIRDLFIVIVTLVVFAAPGSAQTVSFRNAAGSPVAVGGRLSSVAAADFNGDGRLDVAVVNGQQNTVSVFLGSGTGTFSAAPQSPFTVNGGILSGSVPTAIAVSDVNADGHPDLAITNIPINPLTVIGGAITGHIGGAVAVLLGRADGSFNTASNFGTAADLPSSVAIGDLNGDGKRDLAIANLNSGNVSVLLGNGSGTSFPVAPGSPFAVGTRPASIAIADLNSDGKPDLAVANADDNAVAILMGQGDGTFIPNTNSPVEVGARPASVALADLDGDGKLDLAAADLTDGKVSVSLGDGTGTFPTVQDYPVGRNPISVAVADFNSDGKLDIVAANNVSHMVSILVGNGNGTFKPARHVSVAGDPQSIAVADFDGNNQPDVVSANLTAGNVSVLLNATDIVPPITTAMPVPLPNSNGWNHTTVTLTLDATDNSGGSGVKEVTYQVGATSQVVVPGASKTLLFNSEGVYPLAYFATDNAGNVEATQSLAVQIDTTPPTIASSQTPPANGAGWNNSDVTVTFACADALSGVATCTFPAMVSTDGANQAVTGVAIDRAANSATASRVVNLDETPPVLEMPVLASSYAYNASLTLAFGSTDALSGLALSQAAFNGSPVLSGATFTLNRPGLNTFTLAATDVAGNTSTRTATFQVLYNFGGFLPPLLSHSTGVFKLGSVVPVKFPLTDAGGLSVGTAVARLTLQMYAGGQPVGTPIDATPPGSADVGDLFRYDGSQYIYNLSTKALGVGTWQLQVRLDDGTVHGVAIGLK